MRGSAGFTLVEMLLAAGILAIIGLTIVAAFTGGMNIFYRMEGYTSVKTDVLAAMEKMERDLRNTFYYAGIDFTGTSGRMTFPGLIRTFNSKGIPEESLGSISYYLDDRMRKRALSRETKRYSQAIRREESPKGDIAPLAEIEDVNFRYYSCDPEGGSYYWSSSWDRSEAPEDEREEGKENKGDAPLKDREENIPLGVRIEISYKEAGRTVTLSRAVFLQPAVTLNLAKMKAAEVVGE